MKDVRPWQALSARRRHAIALKVADRDGWVCHICGLRIDPQPGTQSQCLSVDHVIPQSRGGTNTPDNLRAAHQGCNAAKGARVLRPVVIVDNLSRTCNAKQHNEKTAPYFF